MLWITLAGDQQGIAEKQLILKFHIWEFAHFSPLLKQF